MSNIAIFSDPNTSVSAYKRESRLADKMGSLGENLRRIQLNTNGTFKRIVGGEQVGKVARGAIDVIIVDMLPDVSRQYYAKAYDKDAAPTLPDCWSNLGKEPEPGAPRKQATSCNTCPMNVDGSGANGKGKACRFQRRLAVLIAGDPSGDVYQISIPAMSLFGKGVGNIHPFESYKRYLVAAGEGVDTVVTRIMYDDESDTMVVKFQPVRHLSQQEADLVDAAQDDPDTEKYTKLTVAAAQGAKSTTAAASSVPPSTANASSSLFDTDEDEAEEAPAPEAPAEPTVRRASSKKAAPVEDKPPLSDVMGKWLDDDDSDDVPF